MSKEHPTPWRFEADDTFADTPITDAKGEAVLVRDSGVYPPDLDTCREIVDAVNNGPMLNILKADLKDANKDIDRLRAIVRRLARVAQDALDLSYALCDIFGDNPERAKALSEIEALIREARAAIGEGA